VFGASGRTVSRGAMARPPSKRREFERLVAAGVPTEDAVAQAGFSRPAQALKRIEQRAAALRAEPEQITPENDTDLARATLRTVARLADGSPAVTAAKALLEHAPAVPTATQPGLPPQVVIFHNRVGGKGYVSVPSTVPVERVADAIRLLYEIDREGLNQALATCAAARTMDRDQIHMAIVAWSVPALRQLVLAAIQKKPTLIPDDVGESAEPQVIQ